MAYLAVAEEINDNAWISQAFFTPKRYGGAGQQINSRITSADMKFYDTTPGGNRSINPKYQFCRNTDPRRPSLAASSKGMGDYYSRAFDDQATRISMRFGKPRWNPTSRFLSGYFDRSMAQLANRGYVSSGVFSAYNIGKALATIYTLPLQAYFGINYLYQRVTATLTGRPYSRYYYMEPTMALYWSTVNTLANEMAVNLGFVHGYTAEDLEGDIEKGNVKPNRGLNENEISALNRILPDIFRNDSQSVVDVRSMASRAQRLANSYYETLDSIAKNTNLDYDGYVAAVKNALRTNSISSQSTDIGDLQNYLTAYANSPTGSIAGADFTVPETDGETATGTGDNTSSTQYVRSSEPGLKEMLMAELKEGSAFVTFEVDYNGSIGESFNNSTKEVGLKSQINDVSSQMRDTWVNFGNGNLGDGIIGGAVEAALGTVRDLIAGAASTIGFSGLTSLGGGGFVEIPDVWADASADLPTETYKIRLATPYGNKISWYIDVGIPLCCLLAGALPLSAGKAAYGPPFMCSLHSQGRSNIGMGMIDSLQIDRGGSNLGWSIDGLPTVVDVTLNVKNLDSIMHVPVSDSLVKSLLSFSHFDEDTPLTDYVSTLTSLDLYSKFYAGSRIKMAWAKTTADWDSLFSTSTFAQFAASTVPGTLVSAILAESPVLSGL